MSWQSIGFIRVYCNRLCHDGYDDEVGDDDGDDNGDHVNYVSFTFSVHQEEGLATSRSLGASYLIYPSFNLTSANMNQF